MNLRDNEEKIHMHKKLTLQDLIKPEFLELTKAKIDKKKPYVHPDLKGLEHLVGKRILVQHKRGAQYVGVLSSLNLPWVRLVEVEIKGAKHTAEITDCVVRISPQNIAHLHEDNAVLSNTREVD